MSTQLSQQGITVKTKRFCVLETFCFAAFLLLFPVWAFAGKIGNLVQFKKTWLSALVQIYSFGLFIIRVSVRLSDRSLDREEHKPSLKIAPIWDWTQDHHYNALLTVLVWYVLARRFLKWALFMHHFTFWTFIISRINRTWPYKGHEDSHW